MDSGDDSDSTTTGAPAGVAANILVDLKSASSPKPPSFSSIGSPTVPTPEELQTMPHGTAPRQLKPSPGGDAYSGAVKVEGLMDTSESPLK
jgi:protein phosphatase 2C family protein 2/3